MGCADRAGPRTDQTVSGESGGSLGSSRNTDTSPPQASTTVGAPYSIVTPTSGYRRDGAYKHPPSAVAITASAPTHMALDTYRTLPADYRDHDTTRSQLAIALAHA